MAELIVRCEKEKIIFICVESGKTKTTTDQKEASKIFNAWLIGGVF
jgi:hypothetical protein